MAFPEALSFRKKTKKVPLKQTPAVPEVSDPVAFRC